MKPLDEPEDGSSEEGDDGDEETTSKATGTGKGAESPKKNIATKKTSPTQKLQKTSSPKSSLKKTVKPHSSVSKSKKTKGRLSTVSRTKPKAQSQKKPGRPVSSVKAKKKK